MKAKNNIRVFFSILPAAVFLSLIFFASCTNNPSDQSKTVIVPKTETVKTVPTPDFNADSAYAFVKAQVDFGPRIPGTPAHAKCADYLSAKLKSYGFTVTIQNATIQTFDNMQFTLKNIIAQFNPSSQKRILLCSHWDTRPWADSDKKDPKKPFGSANDGPSGVGTELEIARQINLSHPNIGVDIIYFDLEDYGEDGGDQNTWCLGTQYWSKNIFPADYYANFGVLLDMVGGKNAIFPKESNSVQLAPNAVEKVWKAANELGYGNNFIAQTKSFVGVDDHIYVNKAGVPCIDIIEYNQATGGFGDYHHAHSDNMSIIDKSTLKAVGQTLLEVIYNEK